ncbi:MULTISPECIES: acyl carrier protein [Streptomyces]|jgi:acyl carrier protein|uniref:Phosphopantetheine-binding protein n=1 Tax=Streptomyces doudnae TaxID=3075536 RepID=A0ABD5EH61_9ACTN|nr:MULTISPECIES: phosphopantetheine-binding protein [unclassified Streptomyces]MDT0433620.1 phosphopantetheine-binding protein [Streptomyces sp. DSM 41981]MYQ65099.1 acyl carrier protein [Streptomyces sp. SID4950]SCD92666.1 acyl carrier protein [Streptomyces sp. SolWspMP-5a-2]
MTTEATTPTTPVADESTVLARIATLLRELPDAGLEDAEIGRDTLFHDDLELESIDLVSLSGLLREEYGERVNLALFVADLELDEIIELTVGRLADFVVASLRATEES